MHQYQSQHSIVTKSFAAARASILIIAARKLDELVALKDELHKAHPDVKVYIHALDISSSSSVTRTQRCISFPSGWLSSQRQMEACQATSVDSGR